MLLNKMDCTIFISDFFNDIKKFLTFLANLSI